MNCKEAERMIPLFEEDDLSNKELQKFVNHIEGCPECKEDLSIYYLINEGMIRLEDGNVFNLAKELNIQIEMAYIKLQMRRRMQLGIYCMEGMILLAIGIIFALIIL